MDTSARPDPPPRGFTLVELAVVVAIVGVLAAAAWSNLSRLRPRASMAGAANQVHAMLHGARQTALATGHQVVVMVFPQYTANGVTGRLIAYEDGNFDFFSAGAPVNFDGYAPGTPAHGSRSQVLSVLDLDGTVSVGPATGMGASATLSAPLAGIDVTKSCTFCGTLTDGRGAVLFDPQGRVWFQPKNGAPLDLSGGSLSLTSSETGGSRTVVITRSGALRAFNNG